MREYPLVSVIVPTYNRKELLELTINSILAQTYRNFELLVIDNYSNYDFLSFIKSFDDPRIKAYQNENSGIIAVNRNFGIKKANGIYIAFCDDDDLWTESKLEKQIYLLNKEDYDFCFTGLRIMDSSNKIKIKHKLKRYQQSLSASSFLFSFGYICNSSVLLRHSILEGTGLFNENHKLFAVEDYEFYFRVFMNFRPAFISEALVNYRIHRAQSNKISKTYWLKRQIYLNTYILIHHRTNKLIIILKYVKIFIKYIMLLFGLQKL